MYYVEDLDVVRLLRRHLGARGRDSKTMLVVSMPAYPHFCAYRWLNPGSRDSKTSQEDTDTLLHSTMTHLKGVS